MENLTKTEICSHCNIQYRIPADKHIIARCPKCGKKYEYKNGEKVNLKKNLYRISIAITILILGLVISVIVYSVNKPTQPRADDNIFMMDTPAYTSSKDSTEELINKFEDIISDALIDLLKDLLERIIESMKEEIKNGNWQYANEEFERTMDIMKNGGKNGKDLYKLYEGKLAKLKINIISTNPDPITFPSTEILDNTQNESSHAVEYVTNNTEYTLTLYYTGPTNKIITIPAKGEQSVSLQKGSYSIVAKVSALSVQEYFDTKYI